MQQAYKPQNNPPRVLILAASPRRDGNSWRLAEGFLEGALGAGHNAELIFLSDYMKDFLRDCRTCRDRDFRCTIKDDYRTLFLEKVLPADALVFSTPIWWYGISGILKTFFDRMFCYVAFSEPNSNQYAERLQWKRVALLLSAEESNLSARLAIIHQIQEMSRYLNHTFVGVITGIGNRRGDIGVDPLHPADEARNLAGRLFDINATDYKLDSERPASVWEENKFFPGSWG
mgnify:CR=1 FL=1